MRFLLLDDEKVSRYSLWQLLQTIPSAMIYEAEDAAQARKVLAKLSAPAVCLFDVRLPGESGLELLAWLRQQPRYFGWPAFLVTGNDDADTRTKAAQLRVEGFLAKPPDQHSVERILSISTRFSGDLLPDPLELARRLGTAPGRLGSYVDALQKQINELSKVSEEAAWRAQLSRCVEVSKALGSRYLLQVLRMLETATPAARAEWLAAATFALGGMRDRLLETT